MAGWTGGPAGRTRGRDGDDRRNIDGQGGAIGNGVQCRVRTKPIILCL